MNYTDEQIIKALESCKGGVSECTAITGKYALDLIQRLKAENEKLTIELKAMRGSANSYKAENERLSKNLEEAHIDIAEHMTKITQLKKENECFAPIGKLYSEIKSEARKEFAENSVDRLEKAKLKYQRLCKEQGEEMEEHISILFDGIIGIINNLLKEMADK